MSASTSLTSTALERDSRMAASGLLGLVGLMFAGLCVLRGPSPEALVISTVAWASCFGFSQRSLVSQVVARALAWLFFVPAAAGAALQLLDVVNGSFTPTALALMTFATGAASGLALLLGRKTLMTPELRAAFAPRVYRDVFLAGSIGAAASGVAASGLGFAAAVAGETTLSFVSTMLGASLLGAAYGVVKMRSWGVLVAGAVSVLCLLGSAFVDPFAIRFLLLASLPGITLALGVVAARRKVQAEEVREHATSARAELADPLTLALADEHAPRVRVASDTSDASGPRAAATLPEASALDLEVDAFDDLVEGGAPVGAALRSGEAARAR